MANANTLNLLRNGILGRSTGDGRRRTMGRVLWSSNGRRWLVWDFYIGCLAAWSAFNLMPSDQQTNGLIVGLFSGLIMVLAARVCGMPRPESNASRYELLTGGILTVGLGLGLCMAACTGLACVHPGRWFWTMFAGLSYVGMITPRLIFCGMEPVRRQRVLLYGAGRAGRTVLRNLRRHPGMQILGFIDDDQRLWDQNIEDLPCMGGLEQLPGVCRKMEVQMLAMAMAGPLPEQQTLKLLKLRHTGVEILSMLEIYERFQNCVPVDLIATEWLLQSEHIPPHCSYRIIKRLLDILFSAVTLTVTLPFWAVIAIAIRCDSPGPVFFRQGRTGRGARPFPIIKFRSMFADTGEQDAGRAQPDHRRVTRLGHWLRRTRLDELPQLLNVLRGEMSLVGPRPERPEFIAEIEKNIPYYDQRSLVQPGLTGWARVKSRYGASLEDTRRQLEYDLYYVRNMSFRLDLQIMLRTIVLLMKGSR
ncbi:MAG: sugar transferase [Lentisphaerae bacterium]|nr:sugar transferase [Lentisphaerota bacterium]